MSVEFSTGKPEYNGDFVCLIQDRTQPEWVRPIILNRFDGKWYYPKSSNEFASGIFGWFGPLPVGRLDDPFPPTVQEYNL